MVFPGNQNIHDHQHAQTLLLCHSGSTVRSQDAGSYTETYFQTSPAQDGGTYQNDIVMYNMM